MKRGEIYRSAQRVPERGGKAGYYVIVSRDFVAANDEIDTVVCAPVYSRILGVQSEVIVGVEEGLAKTCAIRCDFVTLLFKEKLSGFTGTLASAKQEELNAALRYALGLDGASGHVVS